MRADVLGKLLVDRVRQHRDIDRTTLMLFVGIEKEDTIERWLRKPRPNAKGHNLNGPPKGERLNRLWYFLEAIGIRCPEMDNLSPYVRYVGELHAYDVIPLTAGEDYTEHTVLKLLGVMNTQTAFSILRGDQKPLIESGKKEGPDKSVFTLPAIVEHYDKQLQNKKDDWKSLFALALPGSTSESATRLEEPARPTPPPKPPTPAPIVGPTTPAEVDEPAEEHNASPAIAKLGNLALGLLDSAGQPEPDRQTAKSTVTAVNTDRMIRLAEMLHAVIPLMEYAASSELCTDADRALMRKLLGQDDLHKLRMLLQKLTSSRTMREGV